MIRYAIPLDGGHLLSHIPFSQLNNLAVHFLAAIFLAFTGSSAPGFFLTERRVPPGLEPGGYAGRGL